MRRVLPACLALGLVACADGDTIAAWDLFEDPATQTPREGVIPFAPISPLYSDYAEKHRFFRLPEGTRIGYTAEGDWVWPEGTVLVKTFGFLDDRREPEGGERLIETRLLVLEETGWQPYIYLWNDDASDATRAIAGARVDVSWVHDDGATRETEYRVPNEVQCVNCHGGTEAATPIGPRTAQLEWAHDFGDGAVNQIDHFASLDLFEEAPPADRASLEAPFGDGDLDARARAYLDANCAHCHQEGGAASQSGLWLNADIVDALTIGVCKRPVAAGRGAGGRLYDIVPGAPDESVIVYRMESDEAGIRMPELGVSVPHDEGVALIRAWIEAMEPVACE